jgi:acyl carrier protein
MTSVKEQLTEFIIKEVNPDLNLDHLDDDEALIESGIIDSLGILKILAFMDETFGVDLSSDQIKPENFRDVRTICALVENAKS